MTIRRRLLPESINLRVSGFFDHLRETRRFHFKEFIARQQAVWLSSNSLSTDCSRALLESPPENYGKEDQTTVAAFLPWRDS